MPVVVRRMGGSSFEVALVVAAPFIGHLLSPIGIYLLSGLPAVRVVAGVVTASRVVFIVGVLLATTPLMLALTTLAFWVITIANIAAYTAVMAAIYPNSERAQAMGKVRIGASIASIAAAASAGIFIDFIPATIVFAAAALISMPGAIAFFWIRDEGRTASQGRRNTPPGRVLDHATAQSFLLGIRGTIAPFLGSLLMTLIEPRMVLAIVVTLMVVGLSMYYRAVREYAPDRPTEFTPEPVVAEAT